MSIDSPEVTDLETARRWIADLSESLQRRAALARAQGVLMERYEIDEQAAADLLDRLSSHAGVEAHELAASIVPGVSIDDLQPPAPRTPR